MKNNLLPATRVYSFFLSLATAIFIAACSSSSTDPAVATGGNNVSAEAAEESYHNDVDDLAGSAAAQSDADLGARISSGGRTSGTRVWADDRICDNTVITIKNVVDTNQDTLIIDFGTTDGCTDAKGNVRKGKVIIYYTHGDPGSNPRWATNASYTVTTDNFTINGVKIEGSRTVTLLSANLDGDITWEVILVGGKVTFADGTFATRTTHHYRQWARKGTPSLLDDEIKILSSYNSNASSAEGTTRLGYSYLTSISEDLVFKATCLLTKVFIPVSGVKSITTVKGSESAVVSVNFGDGTCDKTVTVTVNGTSNTVTITRDTNG